MRTTARDVDDDRSADALRTADAFRGADTSRGAEADLADVERVLAGDVNAFEGIVRRWQGPLVNMAWRYCRDRGRAEEMAQEALVRAWRGLKQWRREGSFSTWLFALAANVFRSELKRFPTLDVRIEDAPEPGGPAAQLNEMAKRAKLGYGQEGCAGAAGALSRAGGTVLFSRDGCGRGGTHHGDAGGNGEGAAGESAGAAEEAVSASRR